MEIEKFIQKNKKNLLIIGGVIIGAIFLDRYIKKRKAKNESKSDFIGNPFGQTVQFTLSNNTQNATVATLFDAFNTKKGAGVIVTPDIGFFNRNLIAEPIKVKNIQIRNVRGNNNLDNPILVQTIDSNGKEVDSYLNPMISPYQAQGNIVTVQPDNLILTGNTTLNFNLNPNSAISIVIIYDIVSSITEKLKNKQ